MIPAGTLAAFTLTLFLAIPAWGIDPLPPEMEDASEEVAAAYREAEAQKGLAEKIAVGEKRYEQRMEAKAEYARHLRAVAESRRQELRAEAETSRAEIRRSERQVQFSLGITLLLAVGVGAGYAIRKTLKPGGSTGQAPA